VSGWGWHGWVNGLACAFVRCVLLVQERSLSEEGGCMGLLVDADEVGCAAVNPPHSGTDIYPADSPFVFGIQPKSALQSRKMWLWVH
jgi:hypothetical protein